MNWARLPEFIKFHWCFVNCSKYRSTKKFLFSVVYFHTSSPKKQKFSDRSFLCFNLDWFKQLLFEINFNPAYRHSWDLLHVEGKLSFVMKEYKSGFMASAIKPHLFLLCTYYLERRDPPVLHRGYIHCPNDIFVTGVWTMPYNLCQKHGRALDFQVSNSFTQFTVNMQAWALFGFDSLICKMDITIIVLSISRSSFVKWNYISENA